MALPMVLLGVALVWGIAVITPGPNFFITVRVAISRSRRSALSVVLGISSGTVLWGIAGFFGIHILFRTVPWIFIALKILGGGYLVYLGIKCMRPESGENAGDMAMGPAGNGLFGSYKLGLMTNLSNPKTAAFVASLFAATMPPDASFFTGFASVAAMACISTAWYASVACIFSLSRFRNLYQRTRHWIERIAGVIFIGFGVKLAASD